MGRYIVNSTHGGELTELEARLRWSGDVVQRELLIPGCTLLVSGSICNRAERLDWERREVLTY